ncbi:MAG: outer membrane beta-barrel protein [Thiotrichales bacterium]
MNMRCVKVAHAGQDPLTGSVPTFRAWLVCLCLVAACSLPRDAVALDAVMDRSWFVGGGVGSSSMAPSLSDSSYQLEKRQSTGYKLAAGIDLDQRWSVEAFYTDLGAALLGHTTELGRTNDLAYRVMGAGVVVALPDNRPGASLLLKGGVANVTTHTEASLADLGGVEGYLGIGGSVQFPNGLAVRGEYEYYGKDADLLSVSLIKRFGLDAAQRAEVRRAQALLPPPATLPRFAEATPDVLGGGRPPLPLRGADRPTRSDRLMQPELPDDRPPVEFQALAESPSLPSGGGADAKRAAIKPPPPTAMARIKPPQPSDALAGIEFQTLSSPTAQTPTRATVGASVLPPPLRAPGLELQALGMREPSTTQPAPPRVEPARANAATTLALASPEVRPQAPRPDAAASTAVPLLKVRSLASTEARESRLVMVTFEPVGGHLSSASRKAIEAAADAVLDQPGLEVVIATAADQVADAARLMSHVRTLGGVLQARGVPISRIYVLGVRRVAANG